MTIKITMKQAEDLIRQLEGGKSFDENGNPVAKTCVVDGDTLSPLTLTLVPEDFEESPKERSGEEQYAYETFWGYVGTGIAIGVLVVATLIFA